MLKRKLNQWLAKTVFILTALFAMQNVMAADNPLSLTQTLSDKLFAHINQNEAKIKQNPNFLKTLVRQDLMPYVHVKYAGSLILGNENLKSSTKDQQNNFFAALDKYIEQVYAQSLTLYKGQELKIMQRKLEGTFADILVEIQPKGQESAVKLNFLWRQNSKTGQWQVYDMAAEGRSVVETKKQEWAPIIRQKGIDGLIADIQKAAAQPVTLGK
ncbi:ABC transporter substrate-binding protein [[Pasteurella] aerogenes]